ncbi:putative cucumisin [Rosa chinensis]|uniref:Putative cucumisin n=1 Tax=Rosa chinensis TaxID=74649 RepID=A0A2P6S9G8_ROSCH|nr:putative cucumisin [Rosa chinensis]
MKTERSTLCTLVHFLISTPMSHHLGLLQKVVESNSVANFLARSYKRSFSGFAAKLIDREIERLANMKEVVSVFLSRILHPRTTRSWDFIGFNENKMEWHFKDESFGPPPKKWKGGCAGGTNFTCNKKLIGARFYNFSFVRDEQGHGTHTALMVAGITVHDVSFYGLAQGTATGGVPSARIAAYKVCNAEGCSTEAILATFDDAIADGVDIITISINSPSVVAFEKDPISIGAFHAMEKGILTTNSVGNGGPFDGSVASVAPWMLTVAASTIDRRIIDKVILGNGKTLVVALVNSFTLNGTSFPLIYGNGASSRCSNFSTRTCMDGFLDSDLVKGKVLLCDESDGANGAFLSGAVGSIMKVDWDDYSLVPPLPATSLSLNNRNVIKSYITPRKILE